MKIEKDKYHWEIIPTEMSHDFSRVGLPDKMSSNQIVRHVKSLSETIEDSAALQAYWEKVYAADADRLMNLIKLDRHLEYMLRKHLAFFLKPRLTNYKQANILNVIRCDAQRDTLIEALEKKCKA